MKRPKERNLLHGKRRNAVDAIEVVVFRLFACGNPLLGKIVNLTTGLIEQREGPVGVARDHPGVEILKERLEKGALMSRASSAERR